MAMADPGAVSIRDYVSAMTDRLNKKTKHTICVLDDSFSGNTAAEQKKAKKKKKKHNRHHRENLANCSEFVDEESCDITNQSAGEVFESEDAVDECRGLIKIKKHKKRKRKDLDFEHRGPDFAEVSVDYENLPSKPKKHKKHRRSYALQQEAVADLAPDEVSIKPFAVASCSDLDEHVPDFIEEKIKHRKHRKRKLPIEREHTIPITTPDFSKSDVQSNYVALSPNFSDTVIDNVLDRRKKKLKKHRRNTSMTDGEGCSGSNLGLGQTDDLAGPQITDEQVTSVEAIDSVFSKKKAKKHRHKVLIEDETFVSESNHDPPIRSFCDLSRSCLQDEGVFRNVHKKHKNRIRNHCLDNEQFNSGLNLVDSCVDAIECNPVFNLENELDENFINKPKRKKHHRRRFSREDEPSISDPNLVDSNVSERRLVSATNSTAQEVSDCVFKKKKHKKHRSMHSPDPAVVDFDADNFENGSTLRTSEILDQFGAFEINDNNRKRSRPKFLLENDPNLKSAVHPGLVLKFSELEFPKKRRKRENNRTYKFFPNSDETEQPPESATIQEPDVLKLNQNHDCGDDSQILFKRIRKNKKIKTDYYHEGGDNFDQSAVSESLNDRLGSSDGTVRTETRILKAADYLSKSIIDPVTSSCDSDTELAYKSAGENKSDSRKMNLESWLVNPDETETYAWFSRALDSCQPVDDWTQLSFMKRLRDPLSFPKWKRQPDQKMAAVIEERWELYRHNHGFTDENSEECLKILCCNFPPGLNRPFEHFPSSELDRIDFALQLADSFVRYNHAAELAEFLSRICAILTNSPFGVHYPIRHLSREISFSEWVKKLTHEPPPPVHLPIDGKGFKTALGLEAYLSVATKIDRTNCHVYCPLGLHAVLKKNINNERDLFCAVLNKYGIPNLIGGQFTARERAQVFVNWQRFCDKHKDELEYIVQNGRMNPKIFTIDNRTFFHQLAAGFPNRFPFLLYDCFDKMRKKICEDNGGGLAKRPLEHVECDVKRKKRVLRLTTRLTIQLCEIIMELSGKTLTEWCSKTYDPPGPRLLYYHNEQCQCGYQLNKFVDYGQVTRLYNERLKYNKPFSEEYLGHRCVATVRARLIQLHPDRVIPDNYEEELWNPVVGTMDTYSIILFLERLLEFPELLTTGNMQWDQVRDAFLAKDYFPVLVRNKSKCDLLWRLLQRRAKIPPNFGRRTMLEIATEAKNFYVRKLQNQ